MKKKGISYFEKENNNKIIIIKKIETSNLNK